MEILRSLGLEDEVVRRSYRQFEPDGAIMSVETLAGEELNWDVAQLNQHVRDLSVTERLFVTQDALEPLLHDRARELGAELRFGTELVSFEQDGEGVTAVLRERDAGATTEVRARYLVAADGARSPVRRALGIGTTGRGLLSRSVTIYFRGDVEALMRGRNLSVILVRNPVFRGFFRIEKPYRSGFHVMPPYGGFGGNTAIHDAHNLAWKLALVVRGAAGEGLLDSYEEERRPVCAVTVEQAYLRYVVRAALHLRDATLPAFVPDPEIDLGLRYQSSAVVPDDGGRDDRLHLDPREARGAPGTRAPHVTLRRDGRELSTHDLLGRSFVLLSGPQAGTLADAAAGAGARAGVAVDAHVVGAGALADSAGDLCAAFGIAPGGAVLVRPDAFVGWRAAGPEDATADRLARALGTLLHQGPASALPPGAPATRTTGGTTR